MNTHLATVAVLLSLAAPLSAQERTPIRDYTAHLEPYVFLNAGQIADISITLRNFSQGCGEANSGMYGPHPSAARLVLTKAAAMVPVNLTIYLLQRTGHQKAATTVGVLGGSVGFLAAGYNLTVKCGR